MKKLKTYAIILCGGSGTRLKSTIPKQFLKFEGKCVLEYTIEKFNNNQNIDEIILVINSKYKYFIDQEKILEKFNKISTIVDGGNTRRESSYNGIKKVIDDDAKILIHDGVRPLVSNDTINRCIEALDKYDAVYPAIATADTIVKINDDFIINDIPIRRYMKIGQTPQGFKLNIIKKAHALAKNDETVDIEVTNDCGLVKRYNLCDIKVVDGNRENMKLTYPEDIFIIKKLLLKNKGE